ncbi:MAG: O-antigen ligase family protein [Candidatus Marinimicrobia bacterium]|nr:O-antigen ligase family protein [Candidatus Neomarinimicrobiota bacterium]
MFINLINNSWILLLLPIIVILFIKLHKKLYFGIYAGAILLPLEDLTTLFTDFTLIKLVIIATFIIWCIQIFTHKRKLNFPSYFYLIILLCLLAGLSLFWSNNASSTVTSLLTFTQLTIWLVMITDLLDSRKKIVVATQLYILSSIIVSIFAIVLINSGNLEFNRAAFIQGQNPNGFSRSVGLAFLVLIYSINSGHFIRNSFIKYFGTILIGLVIVLAQSRGTYIALLFALIPLFIGVKFKHKRKNIVVFFILSIFLFLNFQDIIVENVLVRIRDYESLGGRKVIWEVAYNMIKDNFWLGVGFGNFPDIFGVYSFQLRGWVANSSSHNVYISLLSELGIIGLTVFILFQSKILKNIIRLPNNSNYSEKLLYALFIYLIIGGMTNSIHFEKFYWFGFGIIIAMTRVLVPMDVQNEGDDH